MGEKGRWISVLKRVFSSKSTHNSSDRKSSKEKKKKKKDLGNSHGELSLRLYDEISCIERILDEAEREHNLIFRPPSPLDVSPAPLHPAATPPSPKISDNVTSASPEPVSQEPTSPRTTSPPPPPPPPPPPRASIKSASSKLSSGKKPLRQKSKSQRPEPDEKSQHASAAKIQAAYRGHMARKSFRSLKGLVRLQGVVKGQRVKRQTLTAMKYMQLLVRVQSQVHFRRIQMLEFQDRHDAQHKEVDTLGKWSSLTPEAINVDWDDSQLTKDEIEARIQRKADALMKRERAMAYAYSNQKWRTPVLRNPHQEVNIEMRWLNWLDRQLAPTKPAENQPKKNSRPTPQRSQLGGFDSNIDLSSPRSTRSAAPAFMSSRQARMPLSRTFPAKSTRTRPRGSESPGNVSLIDDASLTSCPPYMVRNYLAPTVSARAKERSNSNTKESNPESPVSENRRLSFPLASGIGSVFSGSKNQSSRRRQSMNSPGNVSVDSASSMPVNLVRKPFNRFV